MLTVEYLHANGRSRRFVVADFAAASAAWCAYRDERALRGSNAPHVLLSDAGAHVGYVSYNGRVWSGRPTDPVSTPRVPLFDPYVAAAEVGR